MLEKEKLDAVFVVTGYDNTGKPTYPKIIGYCLKVGCNVRIEKPPAAAVAELEELSVRRYKGTE